MRDERAQAMATVCALIDEIDHGSDESVAATVDRLTEPEHADLLRAVLDHLLELSAAAVRALAGDPDPEASYMVELCDGEGDVTDIDEVEPPQRAVIRALLARLAGHEDDVAAQLEIALASGDRDDAVDVLSTALVWTMDTLARTDT
jgi:hypothetical protein